ncbi:MAG: RNA polymerase sigma factor RpoD/SigA [Spirochaetaceae bacterium]
MKLENFPEEIQEHELDVAAVYDTGHDNDPLTLYLKQISNYPLLSKDEELEIGEHIQRYKKKIEELEEEYHSGECDHDKYVPLKKKLEKHLNFYRNKMITSNLRLVVSIAKKYQHRGLNFLDLIDEGNIGLIEAVERFDYTKKCKFSTYGTWWIQQAVIKALADKGRTIRIPIHVLNVIRKCYSVTKFLTQELGREPSHEEIAEYMNITVAQVENIMQYSGETASLDVTVDDENVTTLSDLVFSDEYTEPFESVFNITLQDLLDRSLEELSDREEKIIRLRYGLSGKSPLTLEEIGKILGITRERVRQIQNKAIVKMRSHTVIRELENVF